MENDSEVKIYRKRMLELRNDQSSWRTHWNDIAQFTYPRKGRYLSSFDAKDKFDGDKRHHKIINGVGSEGLKILAAGMQGGMTSPSRPWFVLTLRDKDLMEYQPVRQWLTDVRDTILGVYARSNFYGSMHNIYKELGAFGVASQLQEEDFKTLVRFRPFTIGEYMLALDAQYRPTSLFRTFSLTALQMRDQFGNEKLSDGVKEALKAHHYDMRFLVNHIIEPNQQVNPDVFGPPGQSFKSMYFEEKADNEDFLRKKGYDDLPFIAPRWDVVATDTYGNSPGMEALGDIKMLQKLEEKSLKALDKMIDPPMNASPQLKGQGGSIVPGHVNYLNTQQGQLGFEPVYQINPDLQKIEFKIDRTEERIKRIFFNDLFLMIVNDQRSNTTAYEIAKKHEEKLLMLGPVIERIQSESHDPTIERTFNLLDKFGMIPEAPPELEGHEIKVEYISILAQAQKMVGTASIEQTASFVGNLAAVNPDVVDKIDMDEAIDEYAKLTGAPPKMIRSDDDVAAIRQQRTQQVQQQQVAEQGNNMVQGAKVLSDTKLQSGRSALDNIAEAVDGGAGI